MRTQTMEFSVTYTTDGEIVNRVTGSHHGLKDNSNMLKSPSEEKVMIAYLEQFAGLKIQKVDKQSMKRELENVIDKYLDYDREY